MTVARLDLLQWGRGDKAAESKALGAAAAIALGLQGGSGYKAAERWTGSSPPEIVGLLQWGRGDKAAES